MCGWRLVPNAAVAGGLKQLQLQPIVELQAANKQHKNYNKYNKNNCKKKRYKANKKGGACGPH
jgi:hypothetical protein